MDSTALEEAKIAFGFGVLILFVAITMFFIVSKMLNQKTHARLILGIGLFSTSWQFGVALRSYADAMFYSTEWTQQITWGVVSISAIFCVGLAGWAKADNSNKPRIVVDNTKTTAPTTPTTDTKQTTEK